MLSKNASELDRELSAKAVLTYCKTKPENSYTLAFDGDEVQASPFDSREDMKPFTIL